MKHNKWKKYTNAGILYGFSEPVTAAIISTALLGSGFGIWDAVGFACIFFMLVLISMAGKESGSE